ncbi:MAG: insulinase family protein, partial [Blastocatellia bacterium]|nr:insulinase family protein [Blastocatellia bacterium]
MRIRIAFLALAVFFGAAPVSAQVAEPKPGPARTVKIPEVKESKLDNGLTVAVIEKRNVPLVTVQMLVRSGAAAEGIDKAGLADVTASLLTKGTKTRTATQIAEEIEFLGGSIFSSASWNNSFTTISVTSDKLEQAMAILADTALNPTFVQSELDLLKTQAVDGLTYSLTQPGFLTSYVTSVYSHGEHPAGGTPASLSSISRDDVTSFYSSNFYPGNVVLIFGGDVDAARATAIAKKHFGSWPAVARTPPIRETKPAAKRKVDGTVDRILVLDLPNAGQASVSYALRSSNGRSVASGDSLAAAPGYYPALTLNSLLGGGYSSRLN